MGKHWSPDWVLPEAIVPNVPNVPGVSLPFFDDESDVLDAEGWDDLETVAWLERRPWGIGRENAVSEND